MVLKLATVFFFKGETSLELEELGAIRNKKCLENTHVLCVVFLSGWHLLHSKVLMSWIYRLSIIKHGHLLKVRVCPRNFGVLHTKVRRPCK